jgi:hypothetical protein
MAAARGPGKDYASKPQPTLKGFFAWAFDQYVEADDREAGPAAAAMIEDWLRRNSKLLESEYGITRDRYRRDTGRNIAEFPKSER